ncbi:hypothetical protein [Treponema denticola]|uniref:hypothetical protein n=1 Tax=Treponema denticola TaxID=158 RepID=UPI0021033692|nr:hypothetical protein [Treponema denticola]UTY24601.1 hypothetical protein E4N78_11080 [Treponema denticola]
MIDKRSDRSYNHSHKKSVKSFAKALDIKQRIGQNSQPRSLAASQPRSLAASQPRSLAAKALSCLNEIFTIKTNYSNHAQRQPVSKIPAFCPWAFFILHRLIKPQGTQGVELCSSSQRNNRNVLRIETSQSNG